MIKFVFKPKRRIFGKKKTARLYSGRYQLQGDVRINVVPLKVTDKQVAQKLLDELVKEKEKERAGILPPKKLRASAVQQMEKHLADYLNDLRNIGRDDVYIENLGYRLNILIHECGWVHPPKVPSAFFPQTAAPDLQRSFRGDSCQLLPLRSAKPAANRRSSSVAGRRSVHKM